MALIYKDFAILPVGLSCQVAHQLYSQKDFVDGLVGARSQKRRTPFDWIVAPTRSVTQQLEHDTYFPSDPSELTHMAHNKVFYWDRMNSWFFHADDAVNTFQTHADKFAHLKKMLHGLSEKKKIIAIWTNCQMNMEPAVTTPPLDNLCRRGDLLALEQQLRRFNSGTELISVVRPSRMDPQDPMPAQDFIPYDLLEGPHNWKGDAAEWRRIFTQILRPDAPLAEGTL